MLSFDHISHQWMLQNICTDTQVLAKWLKAGYVDSGRLFPTDEGTPQGGIISPTAANLVLDGLEDLLGRRFGSHKLDGYNGRNRNHQVYFVRYADDAPLDCGCCIEVSPLSVLRENRTGAPKYRTSS